MVRRSQAGTAADYQNVLDRSRQRWHRSSASAGVNSGADLCGPVEVRAGSPTVDWADYDVGGCLARRSWKPAMVTATSSGSTPPCWRAARTTAPASSPTGSGFSPRAGSAAGS